MPSRPRRHLALQAGSSGGALHLLLFHELESWCPEFDACPLAIALQSQIRGPAGQQCSVRFRLPITLLGRCVQFGALGNRHRVIVESRDFFTDRSQRASTARRPMRRVAHPCDPPKLRTGGSGSQARHTWPYVLANVGPRPAAWEPMGEEKIGRTHALTNSTRFWRRYPPRHTVISHPMIERQAVES